ncbi:hypothetical protein [Streptacidiphilus sp. EB129]|uniref:hypothetical protein n=1 Tax=Streptacidiphilus sp. EB129 TaxID=3156262 RepID=UPI003518DE5F
MYHHARLLLPAVAIALTSGCSAASAPSQTHTTARSAATASSSAIPAAVLAQRQAVTRQITALMDGAVANGGLTAQEEQAAAAAGKAMDCGKAYEFVLPASRFTHLPEELRASLAQAGFTRAISGPNDIRMTRGTWEAWITPQTSPSSDVQGDAGFTGDVLLLDFRVTSSDPACA